MPLTKRDLMAGMAGLGAEFGMGLAAPVQAKPGRDSERMLLHSAEIGDADTVARLIGIAIPGGARRCLSPPTRITSRSPVS